MHILKIIHGYPPNYNAGSEVYSQSVCNELSKSNRVSIFTREENPYVADFCIRKETLSPTLDIYYINNPQGKDGYRHEQLDNNFAKLISELKPDIAHVGHLNHLSTGIIDELNKQSIPIVFTLHDFWLMCPRGQFLTRSIGQENNFKLCQGQNDHKCASDCYRVYFSGREDNEPYDLDNWGSWVHQRMVETKSIVEKVALFIAPSNYLRDRYISDFSIPENKIIYLDYGFPVEYLTQTEKSKGNNQTFTFGYIGTHIPAKGVNMLIEAFNKIQLNATLLIYGRTNGQNTEALKKLSEGCQNKIVFMGEYINHNLANDVFSKVDCIVVPSIWSENSPLVIHEAQACRVPVITANCGGMKEYVQHKVNGLLFEHRDTNSLAEQMTFAINNHELLKGYGDRGYLYSKDGTVPNIENHCRDLITIYKSIKHRNKLWRITLDTNPEDCNLNCIMCEEHSPYSNFIPTLFKETGVKRRRMEFSMVEAIIQQADKLGVSEIIPSTMGEPLLYKEFDKIFSLAHNHNIKINLTTNGTFPKKSVTEWAKLIVPNTTDVKISWNGATRETAEKVMIGIDFEKAIKNVEEFIKYRNDYFVNTGYYCRTTFQLTFMQNNMHELPEIIRLAASLDIDRVKGHQLWAHFEEIKQLSMKRSKESIDKWNRYVTAAYEAQERYRKPNGEKVVLENIIPLTDHENVEVPDNYECPFLNKELWISATGKISPCCAPDNLRKSLGNFGNIHDTTIESILNSSIYKSLVSNYKSQTLCKTCNMRKPVSIESSIQFTNYMNQLATINRLKLLLPKVKGIDACILYGSFGRAEGTPNSDIDMQLLVDHSFNQIDLQKMLYTEFENEIQYILPVKLRDKLVCYFKSQPKMEFGVCQAISDLHRNYIGSEITDVSKTILYERDKSRYNLESYLSRLIAEHRHAKEPTETQVETLIAKFIYEFESCSAMHRRSDGYQFYFFYSIALHVAIQLNHLAKGNIKYNFLPKNFIANVLTKDEQSSFYDLKATLFLPEANKQKRKLLDFFYSTIVTITKPDRFSEVKQFCEWLYDRDYFWNFRDISTHNRKIKVGLIFRTATMTLFQNDSKFNELLKTNRIKTIIDLRADREIDELPYKKDTLSEFKYVKAQFDPWNQPKWFIDEYNYGTNEDIAYRFFIIGCHEKIKQGLEAILNENEGAVAIHCFAGKDRTGIFVTLLHLLAATSIEDIYADYLASEVDTNVTRLNLVLEVIETKGGIESYLISCGLSQLQIDKLKQKILN